MSTQWQQGTDPQASQQQQQQALWEAQQRQAQDRQQRKAWAAQGLAYHPNSDEKMWAMFAHLGQLIAGFIAPLVIMLVKGEESPYVKHQSKEALNFVLTMYLVLVASYAVLFLGAVLLLGVGGFLAFPLILGAIALMYIMPVVAALQVDKFRWYRYPAILRMVK